MNYYDVGIKEVIRIYPKIGELLTAYGIDCAGCAVGTCLMKDVLNIHNFSSDQKLLLTQQMDKLLNHEDVDIASIKPLEQEASKVSFTAPFQRLVDEHKNIMRLLDLAQYAARKKTLDADTIEIINCVIHYAINYADKFHHAKEENILFKKTKDNHEMIKAMITEHQTGRIYIAQTVSGVESGEEAQAREGLNRYIDLLRAHIHKEDKILYPWFERILQDSGINELEREFKAAGRGLDANLEAELVKFLDEHFA